jgi:hypothetical protein
VEREKRWRINIDIPNIAEHLRGFKDDNLALVPEAALKVVKERGAVLGNIDHVVKNFPRVPGR